MLLKRWPHTKTYSHYLLYLIQPNMTSTNEYNLKNTAIFYYPLLYFREPNDGVFFFLWLWI